MKPPNLSLRINKSIGEMIVPNYAQYLKAIRIGICTFSSTEKGSHMRVGQRSSMTKTMPQLVMGTVGTP